MNDKHRDYSGHSNTLEDKLGELNKSVGYRDSGELSLLKYCLRAQEDIKKNGKTGSKETIVIIGMIFLRVFLNSRAQSSAPRRTRNNDI